MQPTPRARALLASWVASALLVALAPIESAATLTAAIEQRLSLRRITLDLSLDPADGAGVSWLHRHTEVLEKSFGDNGKLAMTVRVEPSRAAAVRSRFAAS